MKDNQFYDVDLELALCSTLIFEPTIEINLSSDIFYIPLVKNVYLAILALRQQNIPIEETLLRNYLVDEMDLKKDDVEDILITILTKTPTSNITPYISQLKELKRKRDIRDTIFNINQELEESKSADELESSLLSFIEKIHEDGSSEDFITFNTASQIKGVQPDFITKDFIPVPKKTVSIFSAKGGMGKTTLLIQLAIRYLYEEKNKKAFLWLSEDPKELSKYRADSIVNDVFTKGKETLDRLIISDSFTFPVLMGTPNKISFNPLFYKMKNLLKSFDLIILDPLIGFYGGEENSNSHARDFMQLFSKWATEEDKIIIFIHHSKKNTAESRGASAFVDASRANYEIVKQTDKEGREINSSYREIYLKKDNYQADKFFKGFAKTIQVFPIKRENKPKIDNSPLNLSNKKFDNNEELGIN